MPLDDFDDSRLLDAVRPWLSTFEPWWGPENILAHLVSVWNDGGPPDDVPLSHQRMQGLVRHLSPSWLGPSGQGASRSVFAAEESLPGKGALGTLDLFSPDLVLNTVDRASVVNIWGRMLILDATRRLLPDLSSEWWWTVAFRDLDVASLSRNCVHVDSAYLLANDSPSINFAHFLLDQVALAAALDVPETRAWVSGSELSGPTFVVGPTNKPWHNQILEYYFDDSQPILSSGWFTGITARRLTIPGTVSDVPHPAYKGAEWAIRFLRRRDEAAEAQPVDVGKRLYLSRSGHMRRIRNVDEALLRRYGISTVLMDRLPYREQVSVCADASLVLADHGAALSHIVQMPSGGGLVELMPERGGMASYQILSQRKGLHYETVTATAVQGDHRPENQRDYEVSQPDVADAVERMLDELG